MALEIADLESTHNFTFAKHLVFETESFKLQVLEKSNPEIESKETPIALGKKFDQELKEGLVPPCEIKHISEDVGFGLYALSPVYKGSFLGEYTGLICHGSSYYKMNNYLFKYPVKNEAGNDLSIDAEPYGNHTRFINHSFKPNLDHHYAYHRGLYHLIFVANRDIKEGEQFTFNYGHGYWYLRGAPDTF
ncbi:hypothetical protein COB11_01100 [Candidatus Aerophobetes bacterium]|uniref:SET domain-containing protein n=1 Tax=Aerophobetes bacterium TaxID=2030807 RepID=A0A2A4YM95_UNCAE|nr:MAG: hypothetical protein COB11_01100 [Candidatus Aerophobetes bacterium]